jgi:hydroxymethylglutaryl-CoA reductase (NADPH)
MATSFISKRLRSTEEEQKAEPGWLRRQIVSGLQSISRRACVHPIHTIVVIALLASTTYVGLLEGSLLDTVRDPRSVAGQVDTDALLQGSRNLRLGESTSWKWQAEDAWTDSEVSGHHLLFYFGSITDKMV